MAKKSMTTAIVLEPEQWEVLRDYAHVVARSKTARTSVSGVIRVLVERALPEMKRTIQLAASLKSQE